MADYTDLAHLMADYGEAGMVRRFDALNIKNILYLQAELVHLEDELAQTEIRDNTSGDPERAELRFSVYKLKESAYAENNHQWQIYLECRKKLKEYNDAVLQYLSLRNITLSTANNVAVLRDWLERYGDISFPEGREGTAWNVKEDLLSLDPKPTSKDGLTWLLGEVLVPLYHRLWGSRNTVMLSQTFDHAQWTDYKQPVSHRQLGGIWQYNQVKLNAIADYISAVLAGLLPSLSILILSHVSEPVWKLITIFSSTLFFAMVLMVVTSASRAEIFITIAM
ncbi:MAG: hypothetical protein Q9209_006309 [Squamulea sp. 1 TL-2023]